MSSPPKTDSNESTEYRIPYPMSFSILNKSSQFITYQRDALRFRPFPEQMYQHPHEQLITPDDNPIEFCPTHCLPYLFYCLNDNSNLCERCLLYSEHKSHKYEKLEDLKKHQKEMNAEFDKILQAMEQLKQQKEEKKQEFYCKVAARSKTILSKVESFYKEMLSSLIDKNKTMKSKVKELFEQVLREVDLDFLDCDQFVRNLKQKSDRLFNKTTNI